MSTESRLAHLPPSIPLPGGHPTRSWWLRSTKTSKFFGWPIRLGWRIFYWMRGENPGWVRTSSTSIAIGWPLKGFWLLWKLGLGISFKSSVETRQGYGTRRTVRIIVSWPIKEKSK